MDIKIRILRLILNPLAKKMTFGLTISEGFSQRGVKKAQRIRSDRRSWEACGFIAQAGATIVN